MSLKFFVVVAAVVWAAVFLRVGCGCSRAPASEIAFPAEVIQLSKTTEGDADCEIWIVRIFPYCWVACGSGASMWALPQELCGGIVEVLQ